MERREYEIDEEFEYLVNDKPTRLKAIEELLYECCTQCVFNNGSCGCNAPELACRPGTRSDKNFVNFVEVVKK